MRGAIPAAQLASAQIDAIAVSTKPAAFDAEVQEHTIQLLYPAAPGDTWLLKSRLTFCWLRDALEQRRRRK